MPCETMKGYLMIEFKKCSKCKKILSIDRFSKCSVHGLQRYCKKCRSLSAKETRDRINVMDKKRRAKIKIEKIQEYLKDCKIQVKRVLWRRTKLYRSLKDTGFCFKCGTNKDLCVHHIDNNPLNNDLNNLQIFCRPHLSFLHRTTE